MLMPRTAIHPLKILAAVGAALLVWGLLLAYAPSPAWAADITVNSLADDADGTDGECTLREAINSANSDPTSVPPTGECANGSGADTINLPSGTITLSAQLPTITSTVTVDGGSQNPTISGNRQVRVFDVNSSATLTLNNLTVANGSAPGNGGGVDNHGGKLVVNNSTFSGNSAAGGGGGILNGGTLTVSNSTFSGNSAGLSGGGIFNSSNGTLTVNNSTLSGNSASNGGGIFIDSGTSTTVNNSTLSGNSASNGGGIFNRSGATLKNTIVAKDNTSTGGDCIGGGITDGGYNLSSDNSCGFDPSKHSLVNTNPMLGALTDNGGRTKTHALLTGSPAIDKGIDAVGAKIDQRGEERPSDFLGITNADGGDGSDIGAYELQAPPKISIGDIPVTEGDSGATDAVFTVSLSKASSQAVTVDYTTIDATATAGTDYQLTSGTLTFAPGQTSGTVSVPIIDDIVDEPEETFFVNLSNPTNATISDDRGEGTITDDDPPPDTTAPTTAIALSPMIPNGNNGWYTSAVRLAVSATDGTGGSGVSETRCVLDPASAPTSFDDLPTSPCPYLGGGADVSADGRHTLYAASKDSAGNEETPLVSRQFKIDATAPKVTSTSPRNGGEVGPAANIRATFSEEMQSTSVINAFKFFRKGSTNQIAAAVTYDALTDTATLNPTNSLKRGATYKAVVTTVAKDEAGNRLDQDSTKAGLQQKAWFFEIDN